MHVRLERRGEDDALITLGARVTLDAAPLRLGYATRTGALLRIDGIVRGAFDGKHATIDLPPLPGDHELELAVEKRALPIAGLPSGDGLRWRLMLARAEQRPSLELTVGPRATAYGALPGAQPGRVPMVGHAHLDLAWLWTYTEARRKAARTFATALRQIELDDRYVFTQSQPQLYAWVASGEPELFARIRPHLMHGWDASTASMWVEPDLHAPSGESILRQFAFAAHFMHDTLGVVPDVVWLPDTFGFPSTLPTLAVHAGMRAFATTKLQWNETTRWPYPQFHWIGDDGARLLAAVIDRYDGEPTAQRKTTAIERNELLVHGWGDGGGGADDASIAGQDRATRPWTSVAQWFDEVDGRVLPEYRGELYLETHRGTYTTHRDIKSRNAALERSLAEAEELCAWCVAVRIAPAVVRPLAEDLRNAWTIVLRNQFHDALAGTAIAEAYAEIRTEYDRAERIVERVSAGARSLLPRADVLIAAPPTAPHDDGDTVVFGNDYVHARVRRDGTVVELRGIEGPNLAAPANGLAAYVDAPHAWDAWNLDPDYERRPRQLRATGSRIEDDALVVELAGDGAAIAMRIALHAGEPYLRVEVAVRWSASHRILRVEHRFAIATREARFGQPHGTLVRTIVPSTPAERARFEVPAQRWVHATDGERGVAVFAPDTYGWNAVGLRGGGVRIGMSLLRAPLWPDPSADRGEHRIAYALAPTAGATVGALEAAWSGYAERDRVRLFTCDDPAVLVVATKPADDGEGVIVRVRECDGERREVRMRCGGRARSAQPVDACERPIAERGAGAVAIDGEALVFVIPAFGLRTIRVLL
jgi:alpha-mannosidase